MQIYLVTPSEPDATFAAAFTAAMKSGHVAAVLIARGELGDEDYAVRVNELRPVAQGEDVAVLLDGAEGLVRSLGADGVHLTGGIKDFSAAVKALQPEFSVGAGDLRSKHEAMLRGEAGADYLMFGAFDEPSSDEDRELAEWWSELFEVPAALADTQTPLADLSPAKCEFIVLGDNVWHHPDGAVAALELAQKKFGDAAS